MSERSVVRVVKGMPTIEGAGVSVRRTLGSMTLPSLDPFLLLDEIYSDDPKRPLPGFPDHPHRGFETVTYVLAGVVEHRDSRGNHGILGPGSVQWMTAGRGIIHSEMPAHRDGLVWGFQLWVNLPAKDKMMEPRYQDIPPEDVPVVALQQGGCVRVIAGECEGRIGPVQGVVTAPLMMDCQLKENETFNCSIPVGHAAFAYVFSGGAVFGGSADVMHAGHLVVFGDGESVTVSGASDGGRLLLLAAAPIGEPVVRHGPFVMSSHAELMQAFQDFNNGTLA
jgi:redox-sensitive bicupin YhaK (pirin superfamily)